MSGGVPHAGRLLGLDGLRGLAVVAVLVFHLWPSSAPAGFLGVSLFFTLSGFVIVRLLLAEIDRTGTVSLRSFWDRRARRLLPASLLTLLCIAVVWSVAGWLTRRTGGDLVAALAQVLNWRHIAQSSEYGVDHEASPVLHFWSLGIEAQLYVLVPLIVAATRRRRRVLAVAFAALTAACVVYVRAQGGDAVTSYYSTIARAPELLLGALVAVVAHGRTPGTLLARVLGWTGGAGLGVLALLVVRTSLSTEAYYDGGLPLVGVVSAVVVAGAALSPQMERVLAIGPLVWLGGMSYGIYLVHWPLLVGLRHAGVGSTAAPVLTAIGTLPIAAVSLRWIETPVRARRVGRPLLQCGGVLTAAAVVVLAVAFGRAPDGPIDFDAAVQRAAALAEAQQAAADRPGGGVTTPDVVAPIETDAVNAAVAAPEPLRWAMFGDSTALTMGLGIGGTDARLESRWGWAKLGCPLGRGGAMRGDLDRGDDPRAGTHEIVGCDWAEWVDVVKAAGYLDAAVIQTGNWDVVGRRVPALGRQWFEIGEPRYDEWLRSEMLAVTDALAAAGARRVVWVTLAPDGFGELENPRVIRYNELVADVAAARPSTVAIVDLAAWLRSTGEDQRLRPDGIHATPDEGGTAAEIGVRWFNDALVEAVGGAAYVGPVNPATDDVVSSPPR